MNDQKHLMFLHENYLQYQILDGFVLGLEHMNQVQVYG